MPSQKPAHVLADAVAKERQRLRSLTTTILLGAVDSEIMEVRTSWDTHRDALQESLPSWVYEELRRTINSLSMQPPRKDPCGTALITVDLSTFANITQYACEEVPVNDVLKSLYTSAVRMKALVSFYEEYRGQPPLPLKPVVDFDPAPGVSHTLRFNETHQAAERILEPKGAVELMMDMVRRVGRVHALLHREASNREHSYTGRAYRRVLEWLESDEALLKAEGAPIPVADLDLQHRTVNGDLLDTARALLDSVLKNAKTARYSVYSEAYEKALTDTRDMLCKLARIRKSDQPVDNRIEIANAFRITAAENLSKSKDIPTAAGCPVHGDQVHGAEAEELRLEIQKVIDGRSPGRMIRHELQAALEKVDARDSLAHIEACDSALLDLKKRAARWDRIQRAIGILATHLTEAGRQYAFVAKAVDSEEDLVSLERFADRVLQTAMSK